LKAILDKIVVENCVIPSLPSLYATVFAVFDIVPIYMIVGRLFEINA